ncbi:MBL fold metallo-hydrolase [Elizabethkingia anophelis]|nr:MBL fold metallo-hydrolase [Elizabethkingia anophelis]MDV2461108.1 hypothetical protein [Elizabethkingia anophelis]MDV3475440.1 hypothetical protein [Elizabethkingia anophelis]MDV3994581.1 hypothetical protein [Elizabethkingia anophelis]
MRSIEAKFSFFKAGQGSFYGGRIYYPETNQVFTVVYDCGTSRFIRGNSQSLNREINNFKNSYFSTNNNEIELLFISHLDFDHVSGLKRLLREFRVKNIILPYIEKQYRKFFLASFSDTDAPNDDFSLDDYILFLENPANFIIQTSEDKEDIKIYFVKSDGIEKLDYQGYDDNNNDSQPDSAYPRGTPIENAEEYGNTANINFYKNNLQFFIKRDWEFTTYVKNVNQTAINNLHRCLKKILGKRDDENLSLDDLKEIVTTKRKKAHTCYTTCIGEINSHGLVLLHGPIRFRHLFGRIYSDCELNPYGNYYHYNRDFYEHFRNENQLFLGTLLFGDTSINPSNNPVSFPLPFKDKLVNVQVVQVPHHGSSENWDFDEFTALNIGDNIPRWQNHVTAVCNFGYGNRYGHPSHDVLNDLRSTIFLNSQFSKLNIFYRIYTL